MEARPQGSADTSDAAADPLADQLRQALQPSYLLVRKLGEGGMGMVYLARDPLLKRDVAVKVLQPDLARDEIARARFHREAEAVAAIAHPNVVSIYAIGELPGGAPYFVMQYASGTSLELRLQKDGPLPVRDARRVLGEVASALAAAHKRGIVHRDIKPANVLQDEATGRVIVTDFGIAAVRRPGEQPSVKLTQTGMSPGTPYYMSPEQLLNEEATGLTDVYSFGVLAYELLTGAGPFTATSPHQMAAAHLRDTPAPLVQRRPDADPELEQLVAACLAKLPSERPSAEQIVQRLAPGEHVLLEWPPPGLERIAGRLSGVTWRLALGSGLLAVAILVMLLANPDASRAVPEWVPVLAALAGFVALLAAVDGARRLLRDARRAAARGYSWLTVFEAIADRRGDTGALITGMRDYAPIAPAVRNQLRLWRLVAAACAFASSVAPLPVLLLIARLGTRGALTPRAAVLLLVAPSLLLGAVALGLRRAESRLVHRPRERRKRKEATPPDVARKVAAAWQASYDAARAGQPLGTRRPRPAVIRAIVSLVLLAVVVAEIAVVPIALITPVYGILSAIAVPAYSTMMRRVRRAEAGRGFGVAPDPAITPEAAGRAYHTLSLAGDTAWPSDFRPPDRVIAPVPFSNPFGRPFGAFLADSLIRRAAHGTFGPAQRAFLEQLAARPAFAILGVAARGRNADILGTRYTRAALDSLGHWSFSLPRLTRLKDVGFAHELVAALRLSEGRRADAETLLREEVSFGLGLVDDGIYPIEATMGAAIASSGLDRLATFYAATGQSDAAQQLRDARDSALARAERESDPFAGNVTTPLGGVMPVYRDAVKRTLADSSLPRSLRWTIVGTAVFEPCRNGRELIFGPSPELTRALDTFRRQLVRAPSDSAYFRAILAGPLGRGQSESGLGVSLYRSVARAIAGLTGNPRYYACARFVAPTD